MRQRLIFWAFCIAAGVIAGLWIAGTSAVFASNAAHYDFRCVNGGGQSTRVIEQQTTDYNNPVVNPGVGVWSGYDDRSLVCGGWMNAGASDSIGQPVVLDNVRRPITVGITSTSPDLMVVVTVGEDVDTLAPSPVKGGYQYSFSSYTESYSDLGSLPEIAGSNGGRGEIVIVSLSVTNPTSKALRGAVNCSLYIGRAY